MTDITELARKVKTEVSAIDDTQWYLAKPPEIRLLVEALETKEEQRANWFQMAQKLGEDLDAAERRIAELESEVKFPGVMRCNICGFSRSHVIVTPGGMLAGVSTPEHCPNGCGPMWHDTYRRQYNELYDAYKELESRTVTVKLLDCDLAAVQHMSGGSNDYCNGFVDGTQNAIRAMRSAGVDVREAE
ncbi:hypothetical protein ACVNA6_002965 [Klebsiella aerogenes]